VPKSSPEKILPEWISPELLRPIALSAAGVATAFIAFVGWYWVPSRSVVLERQSQALVRQLEAVQRSGHGPDGATLARLASDRRELLARIPDARTIAGRAREMVDALAGLPVREVEYDAAPRQVKGGLVLQDVSIRFLADGLTAARVFSRLAAYSPTVTLVDAALERTGGDALRVALTVRLAWRG
jgi:hypothetical protein